MKKKIFTLILLITMFVFTGKVSARMNSYEKATDGFNQCITSGYTGKECLTLCGSREKTYYLKFKKSFYDALAENDIAEFIDYDEKKKQYAQNEIIKKILEKYGKEYDEDNPPKAYDSEAYTIRTSGAMQDGLLKKKDAGGDGYAYVILFDDYTEDPEKYLICEDDDGDFDFECDMSGTGNEFTIYVDFDIDEKDDFDDTVEATNANVVKGKSLGGIRAYNYIYDPEGTEGFLDAVIQRIELSMLEVGTHTVGFCLNDKAEAILDMNKRKNFMEKAKGCRYIGEVEVRLDKGEPARKTTNPKCYKVLNKAKGGKPYYNSTVWSNTVLTGRCGFEATTWDLDLCRDGDVNNQTSILLGKDAEKETECDVGYSFKCTEDEDGKEKCKCLKTITTSHSGYNGVADFYTDKEFSPEDAKCDNFRGLHLVYRIIIFAAPIITIFFIIFDLVRTIMSGDVNKMGKIREQLIKRIIALIILILLPVLIRILIGTFSRNTKIKDPGLIRCMVLGPGK